MASRQSLDRGSPETSSRTQPQECDAQPALTSVDRCRINLALGQTSSMKLHCDARLAVLRATPEFERTARRIESCTDRAPCNQEDCFRCGVPGRRGQLMRQRPVQYEQAPLLNELVRPSKARNFRSRGGQLFEEVFRHFYGDEVYCLTLHLDVVPLHSDIAQAAVRAKDRLKKDLQRHAHSAVVRGKVDDKVYRVTTLPFGVLPDLRWKVGLSPEDLVVALHLHALIHVPGLDGKGIEEMFFELGYTGGSQVHVKDVQPERLNEKGMLEGGIRGWGQYASKRFLELDFGPDNIEVYLAVRRYRQKLTRKSSQFSFGCQPYIQRGPTWLCEAPRTVEEVWKEIEGDCLHRVPQ